MTFCTLRTAAARIGGFEWNPSKILKRIGLEDPEHVFMKNSESKANLARTVSGETGGPSAVRGGDEVCQYVCRHREDTPSARHAFTRISRTHASALLDLDELGRSPWVSGQAELAPKKTIFPDPKFPYNK